MKHRCRDCHFLAQGDPHYYTKGDKESWNKGEREAGQIENRFIAVPFCYRGVWHTLPGQDISSEKGKTRLRETIDKNRKDECFFIEYYEGMTFSTAEELHRTRDANRQIKRSYRYTLWGLIIAGIGLVTGAFFQAANFFFK
ncbi:MAG: hypothetical protein OXO50_15925 [Caldilineaceae bacterium]|nr:hypothetical protein [Caldilineaceae bacterium]